MRFNPQQDVSYFGERLIDGEFICYTPLFEFFCVLFVPGRFVYATL